MKKVKHKVKLFRDKQNRKNHAKKAKRIALAKARREHLRNAERKLRKQAMQAMYL